MNTDHCKWAQRPSVIQLLPLLRAPSPPKSYKRRTLVVVFTAISGKLVRKNVHATIPKGNMGYVKYTVPDPVVVEPTFCCFPLALADIRPWLLLPFFQVSLKNSALKTTHNTFRGCRVHFIRQPFSK